MRGSWAGLLIVACSATQGAPPAVTPAATAAAATPTPAAATLVPSSDPALAVAATAAAANLTAADFARSPDYETARISPDGRYLAVTKYQDGMRALVVLERTTLEISHIENFNPPNEVADFIWVKDHRLLISLATHVGALDAPVLTGEIWGVDADGARGRMVYDWRSTRAAATATGPAHLLDTLPRDPTHVVIVTDTGGQLGARKTVAQLLDVYSGHLQPLTTAPLRDARLLTDRDGVVRLAMARNASFELEIHYRDSATTPWRRLLSLPFGAGDVLPLAFTRDATEVFVLDNRTTDTLGLFRLNLATGALLPVFVSPDSDIDTVLMSAAQQQPYAVSYGAARPRYEIIAAGAPEAALMRIAAAAFPGEELELASVTADGDTAVVRVRSARNPGTFYTVRRGQAVPQLLLVSRPWLRPAQLAQATPVLFSADDGQPLHGYLTAPADGRARPWPTVVLPHGGPHGARARDRGSFEPLVQLLTQRGYAVLQVNYRGTAGYGQRFLQAGYGEWSGLIQRDIAAATRWAVASGAAVSDRICIMGASFGAFSAMANAAQWPQLYRCAIGAFGVYDLGALRTSGDTHRPTWGAAYFNAVLGADRELSLVRRAQDIRVPVLLVHGALDLRTPVRQARALRDALAKGRYPVEYLEVADEGHGFTAAHNLQRYYATVVAFLDRYIGAARAP